jgi:hypothetical protein
MEAFLEWTKYANLNVEFVGASGRSDVAILELPECDIRVRFKQNVGSYSYLGKSTRIQASLAVSYDDQGQPSGKARQLETMNFDQSWWSEERDYQLKRDFPLVAARFPEIERIASGSHSKGVPDKGTALHEVGHALGLVHEHQHPEAGIKWNKEVVYNDMAKHGWSKEMVNRNIFSIAEKNTHNFTAYDSKSVMVYSIPAAWTTDGDSVKKNSDLSEGDKEGIAKWYPGRWTPTRQ